MANKTAASGSRVTRVRPGKHLQVGPGRFIFWRRRFPKVGLRGCIKEGKVGHDSISNLCGAQWTVMIAVGDAGPHHFGHRPYEPLFAFVWLISITSIMECVWFLRKSGVL